MGEQNYGRKERIKKKYWLNKLWMKKKSLRENNLVKKN